MLAGADFVIALLIYFIAGLATIAPTTGTTSVANIAPDVAVLIAASR